MLRFCSCFSQQGFGCWEEQKYRHLGHYSCQLAPFLTLQLHRSQWWHQLSAAAAANVMRFIGACTDITCKVHSNNNREETRLKVLMHHCQSRHFLITWYTMQSCTCMCEHMSAAADKIREASQEVPGSPCQAASCSVSAPPNRRTSVSHVCAQSSIKRTMRLFTVSTLLLFFLSSGTVTQPFFLATFAGFQSVWYRLSFNGKTFNPACFWRRSAGYRWRGGFHFWYTVKWQTQRAQLGGTRANLTLSFFKVEQISDSGSSLWWWTTQIWMYLH